MSDRVRRWLDKARNLIWAHQTRDPLRRARARRILAWQYLQGSASGVEFERNGFQWAVRTGDEVGRCLFCDGGFAERPIRALIGWLDRHWPSWAGSTHVINVGANIGATAVPMASFARRIVVAFEPVPTTLALLRRNVANNHLEDFVVPVGSAISTAGERVEMLVPTDSGYSEVVEGDGEPGFRRVFSESREPCARVVVPATGIDRYVSESLPPTARVGLVWSDTQGHEVEVIRSGARLWRSGVPLWVEIWPEGLAARGGLDRLIAVIGEHFSAFVPESQVTQSPELDQTSDAENLRAWLDGVFSGGSGNRPPSVDVLLLPWGAAAPRAGTVRATDTAAGGAPDR